MTISFEDAYELHGLDIKRLSYRQYIPGMDREDVESEMLTVLWKASESFDASRGSFWSYWWTMWSNKRKNLLEAFYAISRPRHVYVDTYPEHLCQGPTWREFPSPPEQYLDSIEVWNRLARGDTASEIKSDLGLSQRGYYSLIHQWRSDPAVREVLSD